MTLEEVGFLMSTELGAMETSKTWQLDNLQLWQTVG